MKIPRVLDTTSYSTYFFALTCFFAGLAVVTVFSLGRVRYDDREGPGLNPVTRLPDGRIGLSEFAISSIGFVALGLGVALLMGLAWIWLRIR